MSSGSPSKALASSTEQLERRLSQQPHLSEFERNKLEKDAKKNWDLFYKRNGIKFFKNRHWTRREFAELSSGHQSIRYLLEVGCGCGDFVLPLLEEAGEKLYIYCCDISENAIALLKSREIYAKSHPDKLSAFVADITEENVASRILEENLHGKQMDLISLIFVLSAIDPRKMKQALVNLHHLLKPGGKVLFRDYARLDEAMIRFADSSKICDNFYRRQDGTRAYFFSPEYLSELFESSGFDCASIKPIYRETINNSSGEKFSRTFLQAKFSKPELG